MYVDSMRDIRGGDELDDAFFWHHHTRKRRNTEEGNMVDEIDTSSIVQAVDNMDKKKNNDRSQQKSGNGPESSVMKTRGKRQNPIKNEGITLIREGASVKEAARMLGVHESTVRNWRREAGLSGQDASKRYSADDENDVIDLLREGESLAQIARDTGISEPTIRKWRNKAIEEGFLSPSEKGNESSREEISTHSKKAGKGTPKTPSEVTLQCANVFAMDKGLTLSRVSRAKFVSSCDEHATCVLVSKDHTGAGKYWYGIFDHQLEWFQSMDSPNKWFVLSCGGPELMFAIPLEKIEQWKESLSARYLEARDSTYWHVNIGNVDGDWVLITLSEFENITLTEYKING